MIVASGFEGSATVAATASGDGAVLRFEEGSDLLTVHLSGESVRELLRALQETRG